MCELGFFACFTTSGRGRIRAGHRILCTHGTGRSAGRRWPGPLAFSMHAEVSPWLMYWLLKLIQLPENVAQLSLGINMHDHFLEVRKNRLDDMLFLIFHPLV